MNLRRYRDLVIVLLALAVPFSFLRASMHDPRQATGPDRIIVRIAAPIQYASAALARGVSNLWGDYIYFVDVKEDNRALAAQNARLTKRVHELEGNDVEVHRLRRLLGLRQSLPTDVVSAQVIAKNTNEFFRVVRVSLDREARDIGPNLPVLAQDGVVGTTLKSAGDTVDVRLVVDAGSGIDVIVQRTGARGFVRGKGGDDEFACKVEYVQRTDEVDEKDLLITSGVGRRFPKGIPVAEVTKVVKRDFGSYQDVVCKPAVDFSRLEEVLIVTGAPSSDETVGSREAPGQRPGATGGTPVPPGTDPSSGPKR